MFREFEPESWRDYALIPWWLLRWLFAWLWSWLWYRAWRFNIWLGDDRPVYQIKGWRGWLARRLPNGGGRHVDPDPIWCRRCLWAGPRRWAFHTYQDDGSGEDVEPVDLCPRCGAEV